MGGSPPSDMASNRTLLAFYGHHKCASTWIHSVLDAVATDAGWRSAYLATPAEFQGDLAAYVARERLDCVSYVNADIEQARRLPPHRGFHVVRDPRDAVVSAYFSHKGSHPTHAWPELLPYRERLQGVTKEAGLFLELEFSAQFLAQMQRWDYDQEHVLELKQEEFTRDPYKGFLSVFDFLGVLDTTHYHKARWPGYLLRALSNILNRKYGVAPRLPFGRVPGERLLGVVYDQRFEKYTGGRAHGKEDPKSHYRKGQGGDWVNHFTEEHVAAFKERFGDLAVQLGYEVDNDWTLASARELGATSAHASRA